MYIQFLCNFKYYLYFLNKNKKINLFYLLLDKKRLNNNENDVFDQIINEIQDVDLLKRDLQRRIDENNSRFYLFKVFFNLLYRKM